LYKCMYQSFTPKTKNEGSGAVMDFGDVKME
jgi:hypothetical protein